MSRFPKLLPAHERALFEIVEAFRKHNLEGRAVIVATQYGDPCLMLLMGETHESLDADFDTLRILDEAGHVTFSEIPKTHKNGSEDVLQTLALKKLASDYYDWCHNPPWYKPVAEIWSSLAPDNRSAMLGGVAGAVMAWILAALAVLIRGCLSR